MTIEDGLFVRRCMLARRILLTLWVLALVAGLAGAFSQSDIFINNPTPSKRSAPHGD